MHFHVRLILHDLGAPLPYEDGFSKVKNGYIKSAYYSICDDYGVNLNETWTYGDCFYTVHYANLHQSWKPQKGLHQTILHDG